MAEASGSSTPPRSRTATAGSTGSQSTPSRLSRMFSFGSSTSAHKNEGVVRVTGSTEEDDDDVHNNAEEGPSMPEESVIGQVDVELLDQAAAASEGRPTTPTPGGARRGSQGGSTLLAPNDEITTPQRRNSRSSFLSSILPAGASTSGKGDSHTTPQRAGTSNSTLPAESSTSQSPWKMPWSSPKKKPFQAVVAAESSQHQQAHSFGSVGLTMNGDAEEGETSPLIPVESNSSGSGGGDAVVDEGISMSDTSGKVDFLTSLPLELGLYVLLFADVQTICRAMQVSPTWNTIAADALIWRDHFYRNPGWEIRPDILESGQATLLTSSQGLSKSTAETPSKLQTPSANRNRRSTTVTSEGSIAARIGRRISDIVSDIGFMTIHRDRTLPQESHAEEPLAGSSNLPEIDAPVAGPSNEVNIQALSSSYSGTPSRTRSSTATSSAATHPSNFYTPLRSSLRQYPSQNQQGGPTPSRRGSQSFSIVQSLLETHGSPNLHGLPLGPQILREADHTQVHPHFTPQHSSHHTDGTNTPPRPDSVMKRRRVSTTGTFSPYASLMSPMKEFEPNASLFLDWKGLYRDRLELERRWTDGRFVSRILKGHEDSVYCVALHEDMLISGSRDQTVKVWEASTGILKRTIEAHTSSVLAIQYDGKIMVTGASNGELFVWDVNTWEVTDILEGHTMGVLDVQMNNRWIASCSKDTSIRVWRRDTKEAYRVLQGHRGPVNAIQLHDDKICSASGDSLAKLWNIETGQVIRVFKGHDRGLACVQYDGTVLATGSNDKTIRIWDVNTGECTRVLKGHKDLVRTLSYDSVRKRLFSGSYDKTTRLWDLDSGNLKMTFKTSHKSLVFDVTMDVSRLVSCSHDQRIVVIDFGEDLNAHRFI